MAPGAIIRSRDVGCPGKYCPTQRQGEEQCHKRWHQARSAGVPKGAANVLQFQRLQAKGQGDDRSSGSFRARSWIVILAVDLFIVSDLLADTQLRPTNPPAGLFRIAARMASGVTALLTEMAVLARMLAGRVGALMLRLIHLLEARYADKLSALDQLPFHNTVPHKTQFVNWSQSKINLK